MVNRNGFATSGSERFTLSRAVWRKAVVEELTAMDCPHCPSGIASLERLNHIASDRVIGLAAHADHLLGTGDYYNVFRKFPGRPKIVLNGKDVVSAYMGRSSTNQYSFGLLNDVEQVSQIYRSAQFYHISLPYRRKPLPLGLCADRRQSKTPFILSVQQFFS